MFYFGYKIHISIGFQTIDLNTNATDARINH